MGTSGYRYMYSYGNSVHMNPDSKDSVDERERITRERKLDEEIRQRKSYRHHGPFSSSNEKEFEQAAPKHREKSQERFEDKSWETRRQEAMKARVVHDEKELNDEGGQGESVHGKEEHAEEQEGGNHPGVFGKEEVHEEESDEKDGCDYTDDENEQESEYGEEDEDDDAQSTSEYGTAQESEISDSNAEDDGPCTEEEDMTIFYDCKQTHLPNTANTAASQDEPGSESDTSEEDEEEEEKEEEGDQQKDNNSPNTNTKETSPSLLSPFIPNLNAKLNDPSGNYTKEDLHVELYGIVMETYCGWLESLRLTFPDAKPTSPSENEQGQGCLHLGYWEKTFGCPECEICHRWKPVYTLTCRGCGIKACVGCKFQGENKV